jgi:tetratricopeptide (TPR) repeat protein
VGKHKESGNRRSSDKQVKQPKQPETANGSMDHAAEKQRAIALVNQGRLDEAEAFCRKLIATDTSDPSIYNILGILSNQRGELQFAIACYNSALQLNPASPEAHYNLGNALKKQGNLDAAIISYKNSLQLKPTWPEAHYNLGVALQERDDLDGAIISYQRAIKLKPNYAEAHNNLGNALIEQDNPDAAIISYKNALRLRPNYAEAHYNLGFALVEQGDLAAAIASYNTALQLKLNSPEVHVNSSLTMLLNGDYTNGWRAFDARLLAGTKLDAKPQCPPWRGEVITKEAPLLLISEQGFGDTLHFMRYKLVLQQKGIEASLSIPTKLHGLARSSGLEPNPISPEDANLMTRGFHVPLMSLGRILGVTPQNPIINSRYIKPNIEQVELWRQRLAPESKPIIGIHWQGNPKYEVKTARGRSLPLQAFAPVASAIDLKLLSLQKGFGSEQLDTCSFKDRFVSCQDLINDTWDFLETAAIIANCDLVITSDSAVAHLAGGMGTNTWLLLKKVPDWRWGIEGDTTFWYPSLRLFRQQERGNWEEVMERVAEALQEHFGSKPQATQGITLPAKTNNRGTMAGILAPISLGELIDKITILQIKSQHLQGTALENVNKELEALETTLNNLQLDIDPALIEHLKKVNLDLWQIEDAIRDHERQKSFGETFICLARSVYQKNDQRAAIKKTINITYGSDFVEEKSYQQY